MSAQRVVHYVNQFFAGKGGEDAADSGPARMDGPVGPGRRLAQVLGDDRVKHRFPTFTWETRSRLDPRLGGSA